MPSRLLEQFQDRSCSESLLGSQVAFGTTFKVKGGYRKAGTSFVKKVTGKIFTITVVSDFIEASKTYCILDVLPKRQPKIVKTMSAETKSTVLIFWIFITIIPLVTLSL
jgi:hypothetical protein